MKLCLAAAGIAALACFGHPALAQSPVPSIALKSGETVDLMPVYGERHCRSILTETPKVEVLEAPPEIKVTVREEMVSPRRGACKDKIKGGVVVVTASDVKARTEGKLTFRVKYKAERGEKQTAHTYNVTLFPG
jgi:translation elongation factor EF-1alpha